jgi:hypothetical protein
MKLTNILLNIFGFETGVILGRILGLYKDDGSFITAIIFCVIIPMYYYLTYKGKLVE